jgi:hypothetical protein
MARRAVEKVVEVALRLFELVLERCPSRDFMGASTDRAERGIRETS